MYVTKKRRKPKRLLANANRAGYLFIAPFLIGFVLFLLTPLAQGLYFSFNEVRLIASGYATTFRGLAFYNRAFTIDPDFRIRLMSSIVQVLTQLPLVLTFSFFSAMILSKKFHGRTFARVMFFLPVIISTGVIVMNDNSNGMLQNVIGRNVADVVDMMKAGESGRQFITRLLGNRLPASLSAYLSRAVDRLYEIITLSGIQTVIFIGGINAIPPSLYESSDIEGASAWVNFCKITFPMMTPYVFLCAIYTLIDSFTNQGNSVIATIRSYMVSFSDFSYGSALSWIYFTFILVILGFISLLFRRQVYYE